MRVQAYSNRVYKDTLDNTFLNALLRDCNNAKISIYSQASRDIIKLGEYTTTDVIAKYGLNTYYANMVLQKAKETLKSNEELRSYYLDCYDGRITSQEQKINKFEKKLKRFYNLEDKLKQYRTGQCKSSYSLYPYKINYNSDYKQIVIELYNMKRDVIREFSYLEFVDYVAMKRKEVKNNIHFIKQKLNRLKQKKHIIERKAHITCFGTKHLFKLQHTTDIDHEEWRKQWELKRHHNFTITGVGSIQFGSCCCKYYDGKLHIMKHTLGKLKSEKSKYRKAEFFEIPCEFRYRKEEFEQALAERKTISYEIEDKGTYYIIKAGFDIPYETNKFMVTDTSHGINGVDINVDCFAISETDEKGNLLGRKVIRFNIDGLSTTQSDKIIEKAANKLFDFCYNNGKPLVREDIKRVKKKDTGNRAINRKLSQFAYDKMKTAIDRKFIKNGIYVYKVNPKYTSQNGKIKYMRRYGMSIHESASFCIARRYLLSKNKKLYYEKLPKQYRRFGRIANISKVLKDLPIYAFYTLHKCKVSIDNFEKLSDYVKAVRQELKIED